MALHRRTPSSTTDLPPRSPALPSLYGLRTPPTCPTSPLLGLGLGLGYGSASGAGGALGGASTPLAGSGTSTPVRGPGSRCVSTAALPLDVLPPPSTHVLSNLVGAVYESSFTAAQCYSAYPSRAPQPGLARLPAAPPLVGGVEDANLNAAAATPEAAAAGIPMATAPSMAHARFKPMGVSGGGAGAGMGTPGDGVVLNDIDDLNFGLATCLATPMDPGNGLGRRLAPIPATTTTATAARNAAVKLHSANDILNDASRYGDWVRRTRRRRKLEIMQGALAELSGAGGGGSPVLGRLIDDTLVPTTTTTHTSSGGGSRQSGGGRQRSSRGGAGGGAASASVGRASRGGALVPAGSVPLVATAAAALAAAPPASDRTPADCTSAGAGADSSPSRNAGAGAAAAAAAAAGHVAVHRPQVMVAAFSAVAEVGEQEWELEVAEQQEAAAGAAGASEAWRWNWPGQPQAQAGAQVVSASSSGPLDSTAADGLEAVAEAPEEAPYNDWAAQQDEEAEQEEDEYYGDDDDVFGGDHGFLGFRDDMALLA